MQKSPAPVFDAFGTLVRLGLAAVWLISATLKVFDPAQTRVAVGAYGILPDDLVRHGREGSTSTADASEVVATSHPGTPVICRSWDVISVSSCSRGG